MTLAFTRLHITPLTPDLLPVILGDSLLESARNISYHSIQTFPENEYGYVDLPTMDAEKLKKKYNGATLRGRKIKIEEAQSKKRRRTEDAADAEEGNIGSSTNRAKKSKKDHNVLQGHELSPERKVKRGWTETKEGKSKKLLSKKSSRPTSKYSDKEELLFRTKIPPNHITEDVQGKKKTKKSASGHVVHEFEKNTAQPSFLKDSTGSSSRLDTRYEDGKGWVDEQGNIVEGEAGNNLKKRKQVTQPIAARTVTTRQYLAVPKNPGAPAVIKTENGSGSGDLSSPNEEDDTSSDTSAQSENEQEVESQTQPSKDDGTKASDATDQVPKEIHPLEALFKKPSKPSSHDIAKPSLEISTHFSFFDEDNNEEVHVPGTPFSSQDVRMRGLRSAAPTPDTAHPSRFNSLGSTGLPGDEEIEASDDDQAQETRRIEKEVTPLEGKGKANANVSEFEKKFWEQRGDNNRAWKERRRTVLKERRQRESRARRPKNW